MSQPARHWGRLAELWSLQESPGRPCPEDIGCYEEAIAGWHEAAQAASPRVLLLGVTPEIAQMRWPSGTRLLAADQSRGMIVAVWPGAKPGFSAVCANWARLPLPDASVDVAIGDGSYSALTGAGYDAMTRSVRRVLRPGGLFVIRLYCRPDEPEPPARVFTDLFAGRIGNAFALKWRLAMALHRTLAEGVLLADIWDAWHAAVPEPAALASTLGWPLQKVLLIDTYRQSPMRLSFPTLREARAALRDDFDEIACRFGGYELGERCPTLVLRPRRLREG